MNEFLASRFVENVQRLALGLEPLDAGRRTRVAHPFRVTFDQAALGLPRPPVERHNSCLHALRYHPGLTGPVDLRFFDAAAFRYDPRYDRRRFVPRRLRIPLLAEAAADSSPYTYRVRRPALFPGAAYAVSESATGLRGRVVRNGLPMRWARVVAAAPDGGAVVGRAHSDDRGEFLLLLDSGAISVGELVDPLPVRVTVFGPGAVPVPGSPDLPERDPLWDLPLEVVPAPGAADPVSAGEVLPAGYTASTDRVVNFPLGVLRGGVANFVI
jgi:hypothetical protein